MCGVQWEVCFGWSWRNPFVWGGLDKQWRHCLPCHLSSFKRVEYFSLRSRLAQITSSPKFSARLSLVFFFFFFLLHHSTHPSPHPPIFGNFWLFGVCFLGCICSFLMQWMQRYAFSWAKFTSTFSSLTETKSHKDFLGREKSFQMQDSECEGFFFPLEFFKLNNYTGHIYSEEGPQFSS